MKKEIRIVYDGYTPYHKLGQNLVRIRYTLIFNNQLYRKINIKTHIDLMGGRLDDHSKMQKLLMEMIKRSGFETVMSETGFLNLELVEFPKMTIENRLFV